MKGRTLSGKRMNFTSPIFCRLAQWLAFLDATLFRLGVIFVKTKSTVYSVQREHLKNAINHKSFFASGAMLVIDPISLLTLQSIGLAEEVAQGVGRLGITQSTIDLLSKEVHGGFTRRAFMKLKSEGDWRHEFTENKLLIMFCRWSLFSNGLTKTATFYLGPLQATPHGKTEQNSVRLLVNNA